MWQWDRFSTQYFGFRCQHHSTSTLHSLTHYFCLPIAGFVKCHTHTKQTPTEVYCYSFIFTFRHVSRLDVQNVPLTCHWSQKLSLDLRLSMQGNCSARGHDKMYTLYFVVWNEEQYITFCFYRGCSGSAEQDASRKRHDGSAITFAFASSVASESTKHQLDHRPIHSALLRGPCFPPLQFCCTFPRNTHKWYCCGKKRRNPAALLHSLPPPETPQLFHQPHSSVSENRHSRTVHRTLGISTRWRADSRR